MIASFIRNTAMLTVLGGGVALGQVQVRQITGAQLAHDQLKSVLPGEHVRVERFVMPDGQVDLELDRFEVLTDDAQLVVGVQGQQHELPRPEVILLSGIVAGDAQSQAFLAISPYGTNGFIEQHGELISVSTGPYAQGKDLAEALKAVRMDEAIDAGAAGPVSACGYTMGDAKLEPVGPMVERPRSTARGTTTCRIATVAIDTDWEYTDRLFSGDTDASAAYLITLMGAISEIYERDFNVRLAVPYLRVWGDDSDPYTLALDPLDQVRAHWNASMDSIERNTTHYFTGRDDMSYGGVAYVGALCFQSFAYGVSGYLDGSFPYPLIDFNYGNWDVLVASHELGHNFGTGHTHDVGSYDPIIDGCGNGDCSNPFGGTIMSYCHGCQGGLSNIQLNFHPRVINTVVGFLDDVACDLASEGVTAAADTVTTIEDFAIDIDAMSNDAAQSCDPFAFQSVDSMTMMGGTVELLAGQGPAGRDLFRYTPPEGFTGDDQFSYSILSDQGVLEATVGIIVRPLRDADQRINPLAGLSLTYYQLDAPEVLPDFTTLDPLQDAEVSDTIFYPSTLGAFINSGLSDNVGAVFEGFVWAFIDGEYTFTTESDDGSRLYIGDELVVDNDGLHGMQLRGGSVPLRAGHHKIRIEFFEAGGGAGLNATMAGPSLPQQHLSGILLSHNGQGPCSIADINADQVVNFFDISEFLGLFNDADPSVDFNDDGRFNFFDVSTFLTAFNQGCP